MVVDIVRRIATGTNDALGTWRILGLLATNSVFWRLLPEIPWRGTLGLLSESPLGSLLAVGLVAVANRGWLIGVGFEWLLVGYAVYVFLPRIFPTGDEVAGVFERRAFRLHVAVVVLAIGAPVGLAFGRANPLSPATPVPLENGPLGLLAGAMILGWATFVGHLYVAEWRSTSADRRATIIDQFVPYRDVRADFSADLSSDDWRAAASNVMGPTLACAVLATACFLLGTFLGLLSSLFPLPEVAIVAAVLARELTDRTTYRWSPTGPADPESRLVSLVTYSLRSEKGTYGIVLVFLGLMLSVVFVVLALFGVAIVGSMAFNLTLNGPIEGAPGSVEIALAVWIVLGVVSCLSVPGLYAGWFWLREIPRFVRFLDAWEREHRGRRLVDETDLPNLVARPRWNLLAPTVPLAGLVLLARAAPAEVFGTSNLLFAVVWPFLIAVPLAAWLGTARREPQPVDGEPRAIVVAILLELAWVGLAFGTNGEIEFGVGTVALVASMLVLLYFAGDLNVVIDRRGGRWAYVGHATLIGQGLVALAIGTVFSVPWSLDLIVGAVGVAGGVLGATFLRLERREGQR